MATTVGGEFWGMKGRIGPIVTYPWRGKWVARSFSSKPKNPRTEKQQSHRMLFKQQVQLAGRMNWVLRETLDGVALEHGMTACNYFVKRNQGAFGADEGTLAVDWSSLVLSEGPVAPVGFGVPEVPEGTTLVVGFERNPQHVRADNYDRVYVYVYCPELQRGFFSAPVYRREQRIAVVLPEMYGGREVQIWGMVQDNAGRWSDTIYIGGGVLEETVAETSYSEPSNNESIGAEGQQSYRQEGVEDVTAEGRRGAPPE